MIIGTLIYQTIPSVAISHSANSLTFFGLISLTINFPVALNPLLNATLNYSITWIYYLICFFYFLWIAFTIHKIFGYFWKSFYWGCFTLHCKVAQYYVCEHFQNICIWFSTSTEGNWGWWRTPTKLQRVKGS